MTVLAPSQVHIPDFYVPPGKKLIKRYRPKVRVSRPQHAFITSDKRYMLFQGGRGAGKSYAGGLKARRHAMERPCTGMVITPTYPMMRDIIWPAWIDIFRGYFKNPKRPINKADKTCELRNGSLVLFRSADNPDNLRGPNLSWFWTDEIALTSEYAWQILIATLRQRDAQHAWGTTTPRGKGCWIYPKFEKSPKPKYGMVTATTDDNPFTTDDYKEDIKTEYGVGWFGRQEVFGETVDPEGSIFKREWLDIVDDVDALPEFRHVVRGWDLAVSTKTSADYTVGCLVGITADEHIYILDIIRGKWEWPDGKNKIIGAARRDGVKATVAIEEVAFQQAARQELRRDPRMNNFLIKGVKTYRDKLTYALPVAARAQAGKLHILRAPWTDNFIDELCMFTGDGKDHDDQVDGMTIAVRNYIRSCESRMTIV